MVVDQNKVFAIPSFTIFLVPPIGHRNHSYSIIFPVIILLTPNVPYPGLALLFSWSLSFLNNCLPVVYSSLFLHHDSVFSSIRPIFPPKEAMSASFIISIFPHVSPLAIFYIVFRGQGVIPFFYTLIYFLHLSIRQLSFWHEWPSVGLNVFVQEGIKEGPTFALCPFYKIVTNRDI